MRKINYAMEIEFNGNKIITSGFDKLRDPYAAFEGKKKVELICKSFFKLADIEEFKKHPKLNKFMDNVLFLAKTMSLEKWDTAIDEVTLYAYDSESKIILWKANIKEAPKYSVEYSIEDVSKKQEYFYEHRESLMSITYEDEERWEGVTLAKDMLTHILPFADITLSQKVIIREIDGDKVKFLIKETDSNEVNYLLEIENYGIFNNIFFYTLSKQMKNEYHKIEMSELELQITM